MKSNIVFFISNIGSKGGTERTSVIIANQLVELGYSVTFISLVKGDPVFEIDSRIRVEYIMEQKQNLYLLYLLHVFKLRAIFKRVKPNCVIDVDIVLSLFSIPARFLSGIKIISWEHFNYYNSLGSIARRIARKIIVRNSNYIVTLTDRDKENYLENNRCKAKITTIRNVCLFKKSSSIDYYSKTVLAIGHLTRIKGFDLLLDSWKTVSNNFPDWKLIISGNGEEKDSLVDKAKMLGICESVNFTGFTNNIEELYLKSSILVMSSRNEGLPMVLIEGKRMGLPIVSFDCETGPREIIYDGIDGLLAENGDTVDLANKLEVLMSDHRLRKDMGQRATKDTRFIIDNVIKKWTEIINN